MGILESLLMAKFAEAAMLREKGEIAAAEEIEQTDWAGVYSVRPETISKIRRAAIKAVKEEVTTKSPK